MKRNLIWGGKGETQCPQASPKAPSRKKGTFRRGKRREPSQKINMKKKRRQPKEREGGNSKPKKKTKKREGGANEPSWNAGKPTQDHAARKKAVPWDRELSKKAAENRCISRGEPTVLMGGVPIYRGGKNKRGREGVIKGGGGHPRGSYGPDKQGTTATPEKTPRGRKRNRQGKKVACWGGGK